MIEYKAKLPELTIKYKSGEINKVKIKSSKDSAKYFRNFFNADTIEYNEEFLVMYLNRNNNTIGWFKISQGGISGTSVDPKMIFAVALNCGASSFIMAHNHPSGNMNPSVSDKSFTRGIKKAAKYLDISLLDHIILTHEKYYSFADEGHL